MSEQRWIVRVHDKEYGPVDFKTLVEWKDEGRVIPQNPVRAIDCESWTTAAQIPGLFDLHRPPIQAVVTAPVSGARRDVEAAVPAAAAPSPVIGTRSFLGILADTFRVFGRRFVQFIALAIFAIFPSVCAQFASAWLQNTPDATVDIRSLVVGLFGFFMFVLSIVLWPIYVAGIQIISAETLAGRRIGFFAALNEAVKYWPRVAAGCVFVFVVFLLLGGFAVMILAIEVTTYLSVNSASTLVLIVFVVLALLVAQVWMFGRFFINVMFWQQFAVLEKLGIGDALRESKSLARSGKELPWYKRPWWRGAMIVSLAFAFWLTLHWPVLGQSYNEVRHLLATNQDLQSLVEALKTQSQADVRNGMPQQVTLSVIQKLFQPLLGIAFVVLYFDSKKQ